MMITLSSPLGQPFLLTSHSPEVIQAWFTELLPQIMSDNASLPPWQLTVRSTDQQEHDLIGQHEYRTMIGPKTHKEWRDLGILFLGIAGKVLDYE